MKSKNNYLCTNSNTRLKKWKLTFGRKDRRSQGHKQLLVHLLEVLRMDRLLWISKLHLLHKDQNKLYMRRACLSMPLRCTRALLRVKQKKEFRRMQINTKEDLISNCKPLILTSQGLYQYYLYVKVPKRVQSATQAWQSRSVQKVRCYSTDCLFSWEAILQHTVLV